MRSVFIVILLFFISYIFYASYTFYKKHTQKIPKLIHQIWIGPKKMPDTLMQTWKDQNEKNGWQYMVWTEDVIAQYYPNGFRNQSHIDAIEEWAGKADIIRYEILYDFGGIYIDADSICTHPLDDHFIDHDCFACYENEKVRGDLVANGYIGAVKGCNLMKSLIHRISSLPSVSKKDTGKNAWEIVGPRLFTDIINDGDYPIHIYPSYVFMPVHHTGVKYEGSGLSYSEQLWGSTKDLYGKI